MWHRAIVSRAKVVIVEVTTGLPYVYGVENGVHVSEVDYIIEGDQRPAPELPCAAPTDTDRAVARLIAAEIEDGACLQVGIGAMPNAVCSLLLHSGVRNLGVHTEMLIDGIVDLYKAGIVTGAAKQVQPGKMVCSFGLGSHALYATVDRNPDILCCPVDQTNMPQLIMRNDRVVSINNTTQMDLQGQAASESDGHRHISGTGGQMQFVRGHIIQGRQVVRLPVVYARASRRAQEPHRAEPDAGQRGHHVAQRHHVCRHRIRYGQPEGQVGARAGPGHDLHRPP